MVLGYQLPQNLTMKTKPMTKTRAAKVLREHNKWRRGAYDIPRHNPREIGQAIDFAVAHLSRRKKTVRKK